MRAIYSIGARFAGGGIGTIAYHGARSLYRQGALQQLLCGSCRATEIGQATIRSLGLPSRALRKLAAYDRSRWLWYLEGLLYDAWASRQLQPADLLFVWCSYGLRSLRRAKVLGMVTVVQCASTHPRFQDRLLREEYARWGLSFAQPQATVRRATAEIARADRILVPSDWVSRSFQSEGLSSVRLVQVPFGADTGRYMPAAEREPHPFRVLFVGQVGIRKGVPDLLQAWQRLGWKDAELWLLGRVEPGAARILRRWAGLPGVRYIAHTPEPVALYQQADVFAFPSIEEGSALVTYEALACGLPAVTTANAGSVVRDGREGFIVPARDPDAVARRLEQLRGDDGLRREMGRAARERAEQYTWERAGDELCERLGAIARGGQVR